MVRTTKQLNGKTAHHSPQSTSLSTSSETTDLGILTNTPVQKHDQSVNLTNDKDVYKFKITDAQNINLALHITPSGGDPDHQLESDAELRLYRDSDKNGVLTADDELLGLSHNPVPTLFENAINQSAEAGTYFAQVRRSSAPSDITNYNLDLSTSPPSTINPSLHGPSNLLPQERLLTANLAYLPVQTFSGRIDDTNTVDVFAFSTKSLSKNSQVTVSLTGLSADADVRVIQDFNKNGLVDANEVFGSSVRGGSSSESITLMGQDNFLVQVYQYAGNTNYQLTFNNQVIPA